jgi:hypothetical protein
MILVVVFVVIVAVVVVAARVGLLGLGLSMIRRGGFPGVLLLV